MRLALLLALAGCNQIFGLNDQVELVDAPVVTPPDAAFPAVQLVHLVAQTRLIQGEVTSEPDPLLRRVPLTDPLTKIGPVDGPLEDARYTAAGEVVIPPAVFDSSAPWRLQYVLDGVPHEITWTTSRDVVPRLVVPTSGRLPRTAPPTNSGYDIQPVGAALPPPATFRASRVFTTGVFMDILTNADPDDTRVDTLANKHVSGAPGTPDAVEGDTGILVNYRAQNPCEHLADGFAEFRVPPLVADTRSIPLGPDLAPMQPFWSTNGGATQTASVTLANQGLFGVDGRLGLALDTRSEAVLDAPLYLHGVAASDAIPLLTNERPVSFLKSNVPTTRRPPGPLMFMFAQCLLGTPQTGAFVVPTALDDFPPITYGLATNRRSLSGTELLSSLVTVNRRVAGQFELDFGTPFAVDPITISDGTTTTPLSGNSATDGSAVPAATRFEVAFAFEPDGGGFAGAADYVEVTVFRLTGGLTRLHVYVTAGLVRNSMGYALANPIVIDGTELVAGTEYVLQIRVVRGAPNAAQGDFETIAFPQSMATVFTRSFVIQ